MMQSIVRRFIKIVDVLFTCCLIALLLFQLFVVYSKVVLNQSYVRLFGYSSAIVLTGSMEDTISPNDFVITKKQDSYQKDDIVMYTTSNVSVTHRIVEVVEHGFITKGDANNTVDEQAVVEEQIIGKVVCILPQIGAILLFFQSPLGVLVLFSLFLVMMFLSKLTYKNGR